ncbi:MAG: hypothetical protein J0I23_01955 [Rhizobiales bacterium]|nr:hypothetical protein [Hyphomicrobiales bacterium]
MFHDSFPEIGRLVAPAFVAFQQQKRMQVGHRCLRKGADIFRRRAQTPSLHSRSQRLRVMNDRENSMPGTD